MADPGTEGDAAKMAAKWNVLEKFESHFKYHVTVGGHTFQCIGPAADPRAIKIQTHFDVVT
jgi:hypothetical protein